MQNKPNFPYFSPGNEDYAKKQTQFKANSNPIKANFGPKSRVSKPNKAKTNPIVARYGQGKAYEKTTNFEIYPLCIQTSDKYNM